MSGWRETTLDEICHYVNRGFSPKYVVNDGHIIINQRCIRNGVIDFSLSKLTSKEKKITSDKILNRSDILINSTGVGTAGRVAYFNQDFIATADSHVSIVRIDHEKANPLFIFYNLRGREDEIEGIAEGSTGQIELGRERLKLLEITIPPIEEQHAIASVLSCIDDKINLLLRQNQTLEQMAETLFRQWFVEEVNEGWDLHQLDEFVEVHRGLSYKGAGLTDAANGTPMHNLNSVFEGGGYKESGIKYYNGEFKERHKVFPGEVIVTNTEQGHEHLLIGYPAIIPTNFGDFGIFSQHVYRLKIKSKLSNFFLFHLLKTDEIHEQIAGATNGSTVNMLPKDGIEWVKFRMPPQELIDNFTKATNDQFRKQELNQTQIRTLTSLRDTLLPKFMSGEIKIRV